MAYLLSNLTFFLLLCTILIGMHGLYSYRNRPQPGSVTIALTLACFFIWGVGATLGHAATDPLHTEIWFLLYYLIGPVACIMWFAFALNYTGKTDRLTPRVYGVLIAAYLVHVIIILTNNWHEIAYTIDGSAGNVANYSLGTYYIFLYIFFNAFAAFASYLLFKQSLHTRNVYRQINFLLGISGVTGFASALLDVLDLTPLPLMTDTVVVLGLWSILAVGAYYSVAVYQFLPINRIITTIQNENNALVPLGRDYALEEIEDGFMLVDTDGEILDVNSTVTDLLGESVTGTNITAVPELNHLIDGERITVPTGEETLRLGEVNSERFYRISVKHLPEGRQRHDGTVILLQDITEFKRREHQLRAREDDLELLKDGMTRFLRQNIRNGMSVIQGNAKLIREKEPEEIDSIETIEQVTGKLVHRSKKARTLEEIIENSESQPMDIVPYIDDIVEEIDHDYPGVTFETSLSTQARVLGVTHLPTAIRNILENAVEHNDSANPTVSVSVSTAKEWVTVRVADNGPGIPTSELEVLHAREESNLKHGSGLGLWLVDWVVEKVGGSLEFDVTDGTTVEIQLRPASYEPEQGRIVEPQSNA